MTIYGAYMKDRRIVKFPEMIIQIFPQIQDTQQISNKIKF